jgi:hypothetical protein
MYLQVTDLIAIVIALGVSVTLVITSAIQNARLTRAVEEYRKAYFNYKFATEAEAMNKPIVWNPASSSWQYAKADK